MLRNLYRTNQLIVETTNSSNKTMVVMFIVNVKLVEKKEKSHVGRVMVMNATDHRSMLGSIVKTAKTKAAIKPRAEV